jgi:hypothetical protein
MGRVLLYALLALAPSAIYLAWAAWRAKKGLPPPADRPWPWLALGGLALAAVALFVHEQGQRSTPGGHYVAPHMENGKIVPGQVKP